MFLYYFIIHFSDKELVFVLKFAEKQGSKCQCHKTIMNMYVVQLNFDFTLIERLIFNSTLTLLNVTKL